MADNSYNNENFLNEYGVNWLFDFLEPVNNSSCYVPINQELVEYDTLEKIVPIWNNNEKILSSVYTQSAQDVTYFKDYALNVYSSELCGDNHKEFTLEYGHKDGYGTVTPNYKLKKTETTAIYRKYQQIFDSNEIKNYTHLYGIKFQNTANQKTLYSEIFEMKLTNPYTSSRYSDIVNLEYFQSQSIYDMIPKKAACNLVSGSLEDGIFLENGSPIYFGKLHPIQGIAVFDGSILDSRLGFNSQTGSNTNGKNAEKFYISISGSINNFNSKLYKYWSYVHSQVYREVLTMPLRIPIDQLNYSTNPTFHDGLGFIKTNQFIFNPNVYITTIGLYDNKYQLLAIAKLSKPLLKNFDEMYMFQINLEIK